MADVGEDWSWLELTVAEPVKERLF